MLHYSLSFFFFLIHSQLEHHMSSPDIFLYIQVCLKCCRQLKRKSSLLEEQYQRRSKLIIFSTQEENTRRQWERFFFLTIAKWSQSRCFTKSTAPFSKTIVPLEKTNSVYKKPYICLHWPNSLKWVHKQLKFGFIGFIFIDFNDRGQIKTRGFLKNLFRRTLLIRIPSTFSRS